MVITMMHVDLLMVSHSGGQLFLMRMAGIDVGQERKFGLQPSMGRSFIDWGAERCIVQTKPRK